MFTSISIHALREEGDHHGDAVQRILPISIHALREEGDSAVRGATWQIFYFYPRPPRGGRLDDDGEAWSEYVISIHALREEGDFQQVPLGLLR